MNLEEYVRSLGHKEWSLEMAANIQHDYFRDGDSEQAIERLDNVSDYFQLEPEDLDQPMSSFLELLSEMMEVEEDDEDDSDEDDEESDDSEDSDEDEESNSPGINPGGPHRYKNLRNPDDRVAKIEEKKAKLLIESIRNLANLNFSRGKIVEGYDRVRYLTAEVEDVGRLTAEDYANPMLYVNLLNGDLMVPKPYSIQYDLEDIVMLVDVSGSMSFKTKMDYVRALFLYLTKYLTQQRKLFYIEFEEDIQESFVFTNKHEALEFLPYINHRSGGNTQVSYVIEKVSKEIQKGSLMGHKVKNPVIVVCNDGQDPLTSYTPPYPVNMLMLVQRTGEGRQFIDLCERSNGKYVEIII